MVISLYVSRETKALEEIDAYSFVGLSSIEAVEELNILINKGGEIICKDNQGHTLSRLGHLINQGLQPSQVRVIFYLNGKWVLTGFDKEGFILDDFPLGYFTF